MSTNMQNLMKANELMEKAKPILDKLEAIGRERSSDGNHEAVLQAAFAEAGKGSIGDDASFRERLDAMKADLGQEHFDKLCQNPDFRNIMADWWEDLGRRQLTTLCTKMSEWTGGAVTAEEIKLVMSALQTATHLDE